MQLIHFFARQMWTDAELSAFPVQPLLIHDFLEWLCTKKSPNTLSVDANSPSSHENMA